MQFNLYIRSRELFSKLTITVIFVALLQEMFKNNDYTHIKMQYVMIPVNIILLSSVC